MAPTKKTTVKKAPAKKTTAPKTVKTTTVTSTEPKKNPTSLVMGILSIIFWWFPIAGIVMPIVGIATRKLDETGLGTAGLITSIIGLIFSVLFHFFYFFAIIGAIATRA